MKLALNLLPLVAVAGAFVIPDEQITEQLLLQNQELSHPLFDRLQNGVEDVWAGVEEAFRDTVAFSNNAIDNAININAATEAGSDAPVAYESYLTMEKWDIPAWLDSAVDAVGVIDEDVDNYKPHHPHHGDHGHHEPAEKTVYELISGSKYTTILTKLVNEYPDLVEALNSTAANYTLFAPTDKAFEKLPKHHKKPSKELIKKVISYHISEELYPTSRILSAHTIPTSLHEDSLGGEAQRLRTSLGLRGLIINYFSRIVASNLVATNGIIHAVDTLILPPPTAMQIVELFPSGFSTFQLGLVKTGLQKTITEAYHEGGTLFAPSNWAFQKLGVEVNAFLFSKYGEKYLRALLKHHVVANQTLYSDAFYKAKAIDEETAVGTRSARSEEVPKGLFHVDLPTLLHERSLSIDIARYGRFITILINGFGNVAIQDGIAKDGVIHTVSAVLLPRKTPGEAQYTGEEQMTVEEFKARFDAYVEEL